MNKTEVKYEFEDFVAYKTVYSYRRDIIKTLFRWKKYIDAE